MKVNQAHTDLLSLKFNSSFPQCSNATTKNLQRNQRNFLLSHFCLSNGFLLQQEIGVFFSAEWMESNLGIRERERNALEIDDVLNLIKASWGDKQYAGGF